MISCSVFLILLLCSAIIVKANVCSRYLPSYNAGSFNGGSFTGGVQLLIPSWKFSCEGVIDNWFAHVNGNTSIVDGSRIEFQVLKPDPVKSNVYSLTYHNLYGNTGSSSNGSEIHIDVRGSIFQRILPVRVGYIVGVYIDLNAANELSLLYEETEEGIDIYYWENLTGRMCDLSLCDAKVMRGVRPLVGWAFRNINSGLPSLENTVESIRSAKPNYCNSSEVSSCVLPTEEPAVSTTLIPSLSSLKSLNTVSSLFNTNLSSMLISLPSSNFTFTTSPPSLSTLLPIFSSSSVLPSVTPSSSNEGGGGGVFDNLIVAILSVIVLILLVIILSFLIICICCLCRKKVTTEILSTSVVNAGGTNGMNNEVNPCYGMNINNNNDDDDAAYCEIKETQSVTTSTETTDPNPCYGVNTKSLFAGVKSQTGGVGDEDDYI